MSISLNCMLLLYADDSALIFSHKDSEVIAERLSTELTTCKKWLVDNRLSLHVGKTECLLFGSGGRLKGVGEFCVTCDGSPVYCSTCLQRKISRCNVGRKVKRIHSCEKSSQDMFC